MFRAAAFPNVSGPPFSRNMNWALVGMIVVAAVILASSIILYSHSRVILILVAVLAGLIIMWRPVVGLALYLICYPLVPPSSEINLLKAAMFGLTVLILLIWLSQKLSEETKPWLKREYLWMYLFFLFLCISPAIGRLNGFSLLDWARDIAPFLNLLLIPVLANYFSSRRYFWLLYLVFGIAFIGIFQGLFSLLSLYHFPLTGWIGYLPLRLNNVHPSWIFGIGLSLYLLNMPRRRVWLLWAVAGLVMTLLTHGRTIWISTLVIAALNLFYHSRFRKQALGLLVVSFVLLLVLQTTSTTLQGEYITKQSKRFQQLMEIESDVSFRSRMDEMVQTKDLFLSSPLYGVGFGYQYLFWRTDRAIAGVGYLDTNYTHNDFTNVAAKGGLIGLLLLVLMFRGYIRELMSRRKEGGDAFGHAWATTALIIVFSAVITGLSTPVMQSRNGMFYLAVILALGLGFYQEDRHGSEA
jgi:O-antigen ligase